ncbi:MAG TPA: ATP-binding cassette domain-containing protein [Dehalococcoidales bacterium]|nr:ATP-binding cassette domain-containing protein [Dehalococcoidales bacterium]
MPGNYAPLVNVCAENPNQEVIRCEQLIKLYPGDILAVDRLDLSVRCGELFGLLGPNGAGKTTTVGMLTSLVIPTGGRAIVAGIDVVARPALVKQLIGVVSQTNNLDRALTVRENLYYHGLFFGMSARESRQAADKYLEMFRLSERAGADVSTISGGMARRLQVARALVHSPSVLFLDEPTAGLDPQSRLALWDILGRLHKEGQTILLTTHYMEEADAVCDRIAIMDHGRVLAIDTPKKLKESVGADSIVNVSAKGDLDALANLLREQLAGVTTARRFDSTVQLSVKGATGIVPRLVSVAEKGGFDIIDLSVSAPTLETVFINLTGKELRD